MRKHILTAFAAIFLVLLVTNVSAYHTGATLSESWRYNEDIVGGNRGFSLVHSTTVPQMPFNGFEPHDWSYAASPYAQAAAHYSFNAYDRDKALNQAFKTFQADSQLVLQQRRDLGRSGYYNRYYSSFRPSYRSYW